MPGIAQAKRAHPVWTSLVFSPLAALAPAALRSGLALAARVRLRLAGKVLLHDCDLLPQEVGVAGSLPQQVVQLGLSLAAQLGFAPKGGLRSSWASVAAGCSAWLRPHKLASLRVWHAPVRPGCQPAARESGAS